MKQQPNILLLMADEFRGDCLGFAGHPDVKTPYLDTLAAQGICYPNAYSSCPSCIPARATLLTGLSPRHTGRVGYRDRVEWNYGCTLAGELAKAGYHTECVGKMHVHPLRHSAGFHHVVLHDGYLHAYRAPDTPSSENQLVADDYFHWLRSRLGAEADVTVSGMDCNGWTARPWPYDEQYHPTNWVAAQTIDFLRRRDPRQPFFLMSSFVRPHAPYDAPRYYFDLYRDRALRPPLRGDWDDVAQLERMGRIFNNTTGPLDPDLIREQQIGYYACITHLDHQIGRILMALIEQGLMENTVILFVSDHGEMLSDHCMDRKSVPYQGSIHVPLLISGPQALIGRRGVTDDTLAELRDILPTALELAGAPVPPTVDGESVLHGHDRSWLHGEHSYGQKSHQFIVTKTDKYVWFSQTGEEQYFDLAKDPGETHNAIGDAAYAGRIAQLRGHLIQALASCEEGYSDGKQLIPGRPPRECLACATSPCC